MEFLKQVLKGVVIGVANIIPGVSGGTMMVSMGIYDLLIHSITHLFKQFGKSIRTLLPYFIGMIVGIVALASLLKQLFAVYPLPTYTCFIGLILGGLGPLFAKVDKRKIGPAAILAFVLFFALVVWMGLMNDVSNPERLELNVGVVLILVVVGAIAAATMIIPGVSGSMMLMLLGYYTPILNAVNDLKDALLGGNFSAATHPILILLPFGVGVVLGIFGVAKAIEWLMAKCPTPTYCGVLGLVLASPVAILLNPDIQWNNVGHIIAGVVTFAVGFAAAMLLSRMGKEEKVQQ